MMTKTGSCTVHDDRNVHRHRITSGKPLTDENRVPVIRYRSAINIQCVVITNVAKHRTTTLGKKGRR